MQHNSEQTENQPKISPALLMAAVVGVLLFSVSAGSVVSAQVQQQATVQGAPQRTRVQDSVPSEYQPPAGMCRVWINGVPAGQQPAPTDCASATLKKPANARVIYGPDPKSKAALKHEPPPVKGFTTPIKRSPVNAAIPQPGSIDPRFRDPRERDFGENKRMTDEQLFGDRPAYLPASSYPGMSVGAAGQPGYPGNVQANGGSGILGDPRYFNNSAGVKPPGTGSGVCLDRDQDGWCDDSRFGPPVCLDQDKDGRCDDLPEFASQAYPQTLPRMRSALDVIEGRGSVEVARWLGTNEFTVRLPDQGSGSAPWRAIFLDAKSELVQVWTDRNRDGLAERVEIFRNGQRVKLIQR